MFGHVLTCIHAPMFVHVFTSMYIYVCIYVRVAFVVCVGFPIDLNLLRPNDRVQAREMPVACKK